MSPESAPAGLVVVDKPPGLTSHAVVARARRTLGTRKVGHAGTLDPMATGVLVLGVGRATRLLGHLMLTEKAYDAVVRLGASTTTDDAEGEMVATAPVDRVSDADVTSAVATFRGEISQVPSSVSAIKVDGRRAYARVRAGEDVALAPRAVTVHEIVAGPPVRRDGFLDVPLRVRCSSGTYVRAIARDLGAALGVGGHLTALRRTAVGSFDLAGACNDLDDLRILPIADAARRSFPAVDLDEARAASVRVGRPLEDELPGPGEHALFAPGGEFLALYANRDGRARPVAVFVG